VQETGPFQREPVLSRFWHGRLPPVQTFFGGLAFIVLVNWVGMTLMPDTGTISQHYAVALDAFTVYTVFLTLTWIAWNAACQRSANRRIRECVVEGGRAAPMVFFKLLVFTLFLTFVFQMVRTVVMVCAGLS